MTLMGNRRRIRVKISGQVQGVGFRPTVHRYATERNLTGFVRNTSCGILIELEGTPEKLKDFLGSLKKNPPGQAKLAGISVCRVPLKKDRQFRILKSLRLSRPGLDIVPDIATCPECLKELFDPADRRYLYPFINCTNCGPRFTIIREIPYDRKNTTMRIFRMCKTCAKEYETAASRRFHSQPNCCGLCGPALRLLDRSGSLIISSGNRDVLKTAVWTLEAGFICAVKGLGGFHLACDAENPASVARLRHRKGRKDKPFALMARDIHTIGQFCPISPNEKSLLRSSQAPIVLLKKKETCDLPEEIAPWNNYLGFMLPYTPLHHLLFRLSRRLRVLVMTSGNISEEPLAYENEEAVKRLGDIADYFLVHDRDIEVGCDDSVLRVLKSVSGQPETIIRRSRGYTPLRVNLPFSFRRPVLACGAHLKNTFALARKDTVVLSQHIGDLENLETLGFFRKSLRHLENLFEIRPEVIAYDLHPDYLATRFARELLARNKNLLGIPVQHHHAHLCSCMADNGLVNQPVIGVAFDGTGYGADGCVWGGEFLVGDYCGYQRLAHLKYIPLPGGEKAIKEVWRIACSYLFAIYGRDFLDLPIAFTRNLDRDRWLAMEKMIKAGINSPLASSMGRLFDAVSSLAGLRSEINYEGQAAVELEMAVREDRARGYPCETIEEKGVLVIDPSGIISGVVEDLKKKKSPGVISYRFHLTVLGIILKVCKAIRKARDLNKVALSGGVFQNTFLLQGAIKILEKNGFQVYFHHQVPTNDGGISLGQAAIAGCGIL